MKHAWRLLILIALSAFASGQGEVRFGPLRPTASIGEAVVWELSAEHPDGSAPELAGAELELDASWALIDGPKEMRERGETRSVMRWKWTLLALEAGERRLPTLTLVFADGESLEVVSDALEVTPELAPEEDAPRPLLGFMGVSDERDPVRPMHVIGLLVFMAVLVSMFTYLRKRRAPAPEPPLDALGRIGELRAQGTGAAGETRALHFELSSLVRLAVEQALDNLPQGLAGLTDEEWLEFVHAHGDLDDAQVAQLKLFFSACGRVKYGLQIPTKFLADEILTRAEDIVRSVAPEEVAA